MTEQEVKRKLFKFISEQGETLKEAAEKLNVSPQYLCRVRSGKKSPSSDLLERIGIRRTVVTVYETVEGQCAAK